MAQITIKMNIELFNNLCQFILDTSTKYKIDETHNISHSMNVLHYAHSMYETELLVNPIISDHVNIIYIAAVLHDMCDKKYMNETDGVAEITAFLETKLTTDEIATITAIISTMSYSKVKTDGFPDLGIYQRAYHIVREADLLTAYDFDRCVIYNMKVYNGNFGDSFSQAEELFQTRVFKHGDDHLFTTEYAIRHYPTLHYQAMQTIIHWKKILRLD
jgi:HD superfamily phosphodiesterase